MFRHPPPATAATPPLDPVDGFLFKTPQRSLLFGSNRATPVAYRPTLSVIRRDGFVSVLPATSQHRDRPEFFALAKDEVQWQRPDQRTTYLYCRYETLAGPDLGAKIGVISQNARMNVARWLNRIITQQGAA